MRIILNKQVRWGYIIAFLLLLISYFLIFFAIQQQLREYNSITQTFSVINKLESLRADITDAEAGVRGYVITQDVRYLKPYNMALKNIPGVMLELKEITTDDKQEQKTLDILDKLVKRRIGFISDGLQKFQESGFSITEEMNKQSEASRTTMDSIRTYITKMNEVEEEQMHQRKNKLSEFFKSSKIITIISLIIALLAIFFSWLTYIHENRAKLLADNKAELYREELEQNIKELQQANTELQELKSIEKFAATGRIARTIAHEVRNPLTNISLAGEQLQELAGKNPDSTGLLDMVSRNASRINQLVSDLLNATRFVQLEFTETDVNQLLEETLELAKDRIELNNIKVEKYYAKDLYPVMADKEKMKLALLNIIVNAIEAMEKNTGVLQLRTKKQGNKCMIEIKDNGTGMDEDMMQKLFEPYVTAKTDGNGLGLTNTQNIILNHKGKIKAYSKTGQGTSFIVTLSQAELEN